MESEEHLGRSVGNPLVGGWQGGVQKEIGETTDTFLVEVLARYCRGHPYPKTRSIPLRIAPVSHWRLQSLTLSWIVPTSRTLSKSFPCSPSQAGLPRESAVTCIGEEEAGEGLWKGAGSRAGSGGSRAATQPQCRAHPTLQGAAAGARALG